MKLLFREPNAHIFGEGPATFEWRPGGSNVCVAGSSGLVRIYSRYGEVTEEFTINEAVVIARWDREGELLAITTDKSPTLVLFELSIGNLQTVDISVGAKASPTFMAWSPIQPQLLIGDSRGNIVLYNHHNSRKIPIMGKHQKGITTGAWSRDGQTFALGSEDTTITINSTESGDTLKSFSCKGEIDCLQFIHFKVHTSSAGQRGSANNKAEEFLSAVVGRKNLMIIKLSEPEAPINLQFQERYGNILQTEWFGNGSIIVGFDKGFIVCLSAERPAEVSQEVFSIQEYKSHLSSFSINGPSGKLYSVGDNLLKTRDLYDPSEVSDMVDVDSDEKGPVRVAVSEDGSLAAVSGKAGSFSIYLTKLPVLAAAFKSYIAVLSSLTEISIYQDGDMQPSLTLNVKIEPSLIAVGPKHVAVVLNNCAWFYEIKRTASVLVAERDYITTLVKLRLNGDYVMAKLDDKLQLNRIIDAQQEGEEQPAEAPIEGRMFPDASHANASQEGGGAEIIDADITERFLIYCTKARFIYVYSLSEHKFVSDYRHSAPVRQLFAEHDGIRLCFIDNNQDAFILLDDALTKIPAVEEGGAGAPMRNYKGFLWETFTIDKDTLVAHDGSSIFVFFVSRTMKGEQVLVHLSTVPIPFANTPLMLSKGIVYCQTQNGRVNTVLLKSHKSESSFDGKSLTELREMLQQSLTLKRWRNAWRICDFLKENTAWQLFGRATMEDMNIDLAIRIFRYVGDVAMVWTLEDLLFVEDRLALGGHIAAILGNFDLADDLFSQSQDPATRKAALEMRRDVQHWDRALELARQNAPHEIPLISKEYAIQLEFLGQYEESLKYYEEGLINEEEEEEVSMPSTSAGVLADSLKGSVEEHNWLCKAGIARMAIHVGDLRRGVERALEISGRAAKKECGAILEQMKQFGDAARLYEAGQFYDRATANYLRSKNWVKVNELIDQVRSPKILTQYGKVLLAEGKYERALKVFEKARDYESQIRILLNHLNRIDEAVQLAQESRSIDGAKIVAKHFTDVGNNESAIKYLVLSQCYQEAYELAENFQLVNAYADALESSGSTNTHHFVQLTEYFNANGNLLMAGKFAGLSKNYGAAIEYLLRSTRQGGKDGEEAAVRYAVQFAAESGEQPLIYKVIDHLMGEKDGIPKDPAHLFQLYVRLGMYPEAAKTATIIAGDQQSKGAYKNAHDLLLNMHQTLREHRIHIPADMKNSLQLLHSYSIIKGLLKRGEEYTAAHLLIRIVQSINQFPMHAVPILTSAVITCSKAGLKAPAFRFATQLLQPQHRHKIDEKYRRKVEMIVRKGDREGGEVEERHSPCPHCNAPLLEFSLTCGECKSAIPSCIVTGKHVVAEDFTLCPSCHFPATLSEFNRLSIVGESCPMCHKPISSSVTARSYNDYVHSQQQEEEDREGAI